MFGVALNKSIPFVFNVPRVIGLICICLVLYSLKTNEFWKQAYSQKNSKQNLVLFLIIDLGILAIFFINNSCSSMTDDLYSNNLVKALSNGEVEISGVPDNTKLEELENPYDSVEREKLKRGEDYIWDAAYYSGKYYVYFGALPAVLVMLPYYLITRKLMTSSVATLIFSLLSIPVLVITIKKIFQKYYKELPFKYMALSSLIMIFGTHLIIVNVAPRFYELVTVRSDFSLR